jgi:hypothetical protein
MDAYDETHVYLKTHNELNLSESEVSGGQYFESPWRHLKQDQVIVGTALMEHMLDVMTSYAGPLQSSDGPVTVSIIANVGTEEAAAYTGTLMPEDVASLVKEAAMHETVNQEIIEVLHYIGLNFGLLLGSVDVPPTEFFINLKKGQPKVVIVVGGGHRVRVVSLRRLRRLHIR